MNSFAPTLPMSDVLLQLQQDSPLLVAAYDAGDRLQHANPAYRQAYGLEPEAAPRWSELMASRHQAGLGELIEADDFNAWLAVALTRRRKLPFRAFELELVDGRRIWMTETLHASGWLLCMGSDISGLRATAGGQGRRADDSDPLTGLGGRRSTLQMLQRSLVQDEAWPLSIALLALDESRSPDTRGAAPAEVQARQQDFGRHLQACIRREDGCGRLNERDYLLILPNAGPGQARSIVERLLGRVRQSLARPGSPAAGLTCSTGLTQANWGESADALLQRAAQALTRAQAAGGDRLDADEAGV